MGSVNKNLSNREKNARARAAKATRKPLGPEYVSHYLLLTADTELVIGWLHVATVAENLLGYCHAPQAELQHLVSQLITCLDDLERACNQGDPPAFRKAQAQIERRCERAARQYKKLLRETAPRGLAALR